MSGNAISIEKRILEISLDYKKDKEALDKMYVSIVDEINSKGVPIDKIHPVLKFTNFKYYDTKRKHFSPVNTPIDDGSQLITFEDSSDDFKIKFE